MLFLLCLAYLVHGWVVLPELVVNADQMGVHLLPIGNERTYPTKGSRDVTVAGRDDKRQVTSLLSCFAAGNVLPV